jgi:hypothetical protein
MNIYVKSVAEDSVKAMQSLEALMCAESALNSTQNKVSLPMSGKLLN